MLQSSAGTKQKNTKLKELRTRSVTLTVPLYQCYLFYELCSCYSLSLQSCTHSALQKYGSQSKRSMRIASAFFFLLSCFDIHAFEGKLVDPKDTCQNTSSYKTSCRKIGSIIPPRILMVKHYTKK